jgi:hypothetical protein
MHLLYLMRYSFFGQSGWRGEASKDADKLFDPARLDEREYFLRKVALPSLRDQSDHDFNLVVLSSTLMPKLYQDRLIEACSDILGPRAHVIFRDPGSTSDMFHKYRRQVFNRYAFTAQVVLDDDDALAVDFNADLRGEANAAMMLRKVNQPDYVFLSWPRGVTAQFKDKSLTIYPRNVPATNLGLTVVAPSSSNRSPFRVAHHKILHRRPVRVIHTLEPQYIRALHGSNDSRGRFDDTPMPADALPGLYKTFPLLKELGSDWPITNALPEADTAEAEKV